METKNTFVKKFGTSFLTTLAIITGMWAAFAAWTATETSWTESSFNDGQAITNNMISALTMWYTKNATWQKVYWRKFNTSTYNLWSAQNLCNDNGMSLPTTATFKKMYENNYSWIDADATYKAFRSISAVNTYHWTQSKHDWPSWNAYYHDAFYTNSTNWTYPTWTTAYQVVCVYKN